MLALIAIVGVLFLVMVESRGAVLSLVLTLPLFLFYGSRKRNIIVGLVVLCGVIAFTVFFVPTIIQRFGLWHSIQDLLSDQEMRLDAWKAAIRMIRDHPLAGIGLGMWDKYIHLYTQRIFLWKDSLGQPFVIYINSAHHFFLHYGSAGGILTLGTLILLVLATLKAAIFACRTAARGSDIYPIALGLLWSFSAFLIGGMFGGFSDLGETPGPSYEFQTDIYHGLLLWITIGLTLVIAKLSERMGR
jgi:O-antigen ligase